MKRPVTMALALAAAATAGGCSDIGKINGVDVSRVAGENPNATYCDKNPAVCIIAGAAAIGGTAMVIREITKDRKTVPASDGGD